MKETIEHNNRFYGEELKTESEQYKEWLVIANKEIEELKDENEKLTKEWLKSQEKRRKAIEYIQDRYDGEVLTHTFDKDNVKELLEILDK